MQEGENEPKWAFLNQMCLRENTHLPSSYLELSLTSATCLIWLILSNSTISLANCKNVQPYNDLLNISNRGIKLGVG